MTVRNVYYSVTNTYQIRNISVKESYDSFINQAIIQADSTSLDLGDSATVTIGYDTDNGLVLTGYVTSIRERVPAGGYTITIEDELYKAEEYFMASNNPDAPFSRSNILTQHLVRDLLEEAEITNFSWDVPLSVTWGTGGTSVEFNLVSVADAVRTIVDALAWHIYTQRDGDVWLVERHSYVEAGDTPSFTWSTASGDKILVASHDKSVENLRNRIVVYGSSGISRTSSASSPYLPANFYKTAVIATPVITSGSQAKQIADLNLDNMNRLTELLAIQLEGDWNVKPRDIATVTISELGIDDDWFIYSVDHQISQAGYLMNLVLTR